MPKHTFKKFQRAKDPPKFKINETVLQILQQLADYRFLNSKHLIALNPDITDRSVKRRLQHLYQAGFVERPAQQAAYFEPSSHLVYSLGKKGAQLVFPNTRIQQTWIQKNKRIKPFFLLHLYSIKNKSVIF